MTARSEKIYLYLLIQIYSVIIFFQVVNTSVYI